MKVVLIISALFLFSCKEEKQTKCYNVIDKHIGYSKSGQSYYYVVLSYGNQIYSESASIQDYYACEKGKLLCREEDTQNTMIVIVCIGILFILVILKFFN